jgi:exosortase/archaeosortase family protein
MATATEKVYRPIMLNEKRLDMSVNLRKKRLNKEPLVIDFLKKTGQKQTRSIAGMIKGWSRQHPVFLFLVVFAGLMGVFYAIALFTPFYERQFPYYLGFNARLSGYILGFLGQNITVWGTSISSPAFSITIKHGCDAIEPTVLFICAVLAFPLPFSKKIAGIITGSLLLGIINIVRIVTLFVVGAYWPWAFDVMHVDVWQGLFIFLAILFWIFWLLWTGKNQVTRQNIQA